MKRVPELRALSDHHHTGLVLARRCREAGRPGSSVSPAALWRQVLEAFSSQLEPHFQIEEQYLLPGLEAIGEASLANQIREDHRSLRTLRDSEPVDRALLARFGERLESHIRYEERHVFEPTQDRLPPSTLTAIAVACDAISRVYAASPEV